VFPDTPPHRGAWLVTGPHRPHPALNAQIHHNSPTRFAEEAKKEIDEKLAEYEKRKRKRHKLRHV